MADLLIMAGGGHVPAEDRHRRAARIRELCHGLKELEKDDG